MGVLELTFLVQWRNPEFSRDKVYVMRHEFRCYVSGYSGHVFATQRILEKGKQNLHDAPRKAYHHNSMERVRRLHLCWNVQAPVAASCRKYRDCYCEI